MEVFNWESDRIYLRELKSSDSFYFFLLNENPKVIQFTGDRSFTNSDEALEFLKNYNPYSTFKMGRWAVISKLDDSFLGWCGLKFDAENNEVDLGFRFFEEYWGNGYATEASRICLKYGFEVLDLSAIVGRVMSKNLASIRVLEKLGFNFDKMLNRNDSFEWKQYILTKEEYSKK